MAKRSTIGDNPLDGIVPTSQAAFSKDKGAGGVDGQAGPARPAKSRPRAPQTKPRASVLKKAAAKPRADVQTLAARPSPAAQVAPGEPSAPAALAASSILDRVEGLEQDNQCMRWLVGGILAPLALLALLL